VIETITLSPSQVGLGDLNELSLLTLMADTHYRVLTRGTGTSPRAILNKAGQPLYPSIFALHLRVPPGRLIESYPLWEQVAVGADVRGFGRSFLDVRGALGRVGEVPEDPERWTDGAFASARWAGAWTVDDASHDVSMPAAGSLAELGRLAAVPELLTEFRAVHGRGAIGEPSASARFGKPILYPVVAGRDAARGRQMMFSQFVVVMDHAEREFLTERLQPAFPRELVDCRTTLERRVFYTGNCRADDVVAVSIRGHVGRVPEDLLGADSPLVPAAALTLTMELTEHRSKRLLALCETRKLLAVPTSLSHLTREAARMLARHGDGTPLMEVAW